MPVLDKGGGFVIRETSILFVETDQGVEDLAEV
jgi:hypothetical protein